MIQLPDFSLPPETPDQAMLRMLLTENEALLELVRELESDNERLREQLAELDDD